MELNRLLVFKSVKFNFSKGCLKIYKCISGDVELIDLNGNLEFLELMLLVFNV